MSQNYTYDTLMTLLQSYNVRKDDAFIQKIPTFVSLAENRIATDMKQQGFQTPVNGSFDPTAETMEKPAWWRETISFSYIDANGQRQPILLRGYDYCRNYNPSGVAGPPKFYSDYNFGNFLITPKPDATYPFELTYYARLQPLDADNQSNWMTLNIPQVLVAACMLEAAIWTKNAGDMQKWQAEYDSHKASVLGENAERMADRNLAVTRA